MGFSLTPPGPRLAAPFLNVRTRSSENASAPPAQIRIEVRSRSRTPASCRIRYIAGVPENSVGRNRSNASRIRSGSNLEMKYAGMPIASCETIAA